MRFIPKGSRDRWNRLAILAVLALFLAAGYARYATGEGDDLSSSYIGCRLVATGQADHLYAFDPSDFAAIGPDDPWQTAADQGGFDGFLHPYVQTPLWAYALKPLCMHTRFDTFERLFAALTLLSFAACIWLIARFWTPDLFNPFAIGLLLLGLWLSEPFRYAMALMQTHVLFLLLTLASLILAERRRPGWAGLLLACAAAVKITPGVLLLYWLLTRRWKAAASMALWSVSLGLLTLAVSGEHLVAIYLADLHRISTILLVSLNNQSFAAWCMGRFYPRDEILHFQMLPLPASIRLASTALLIACTAVGGLIDRRNQPQLTEARPHESPGSTSAPLGAMLALVAATLFAPIAWTHYSIILIAPLMVLTHYARALRSWGIAAAILLIAALNLQPLAPDVENILVGRFALVRSEFYAQALCLLVLGIVSWIVRRSPEPPPASAVPETP